MKDGYLTLVRRYGTDGKSELGYFGLAPRELRFAAEFVNSLVAGKKGTQLRDDVVAQFHELEGQITATTTQTAAKNLIQQLGDSLPSVDKESRFMPLPTGFDKSVIPMLPERIYIPAVKDLSDDTKTAEGSPFGKILAIVMKAIEPRLAEEPDLFEKLSRKLTRVMHSDGTFEDNRLEEVRHIETTIQRFVRESFPNVDLKIDIPPPEIKTILSTARILANDGVEGPLELKGDGLRRAVVFSILRTYVELSRESTSSGDNAQPPTRRYLLLFEEPELFLHPDAQKILFEALSVFAKHHHVVVTTHSPLFLGPDATATFVRLTKETAEGISKPFTKANPVDLNGIEPRDEFQIICFENNNAVFFAKRVVLVEGDSDLVVLPHIAAALDPSWICHIRSVAFVRVSGKGSFARYRNFCRRFGVPIFIIADLDIIDDGFDKLEPTETAKNLRSDLIQLIDAANTAAGVGAVIKTDDIKQAQTKPELHRLWENVRAAKAAYDTDKARFPELDKAVEEFFTWEKKNIRRECLRKAESLQIKNAKLALLWELRKSGVFILERGALDDYYPANVTGPDKLSRAQAFRKAFTTREQILPLSQQQSCPDTARVATEFDFVCSAIFS